MDDLEKVEPMSRQGQPTKLKKKIVHKGCPKVTIDKVRLLTENDWNG